MHKYKGGPILRKSEIDLFSWPKTEIYRIFQQISDTKTVMEMEISFRWSENGNCQYNSHGHQKS